MDYQQLVEEITRLVILELQKEATPVDISVAPTANVVVCLDPEIKDLGNIIGTLCKTAGKANYKIVVCNRLKDILSREAAKGGLRYTPVVAPERHQYESLIQGADQVVIPFLSITTLAKIANLIGDDSAPGVGIQALMAGVPLTVCTDHIHGLKFSDSLRPKKLLAMIQDHLTTLQEMGVNLVQLQALPEALGEKKPEKPATTATGMKNVVTNEDVMVAMNQKLKQLTFPRGTIVTPLARETAKNFGIEINIV